MDYQLELINVAKHYKDFVAVDDNNLQVQKGEIISLLGASGCGKTTTLRMIAGLIEPTHGTIRIEGQDMKGIPPHKRDISMVFQNYALFPHLNVFENIVYGLKMRGIKDKNVLLEKAEEMMDIVQLHGVAGRLPRELSGGQQQRVSLARAMIVKPRLMLFDEPLSNLDAKLREQTRVEIRNLLKKMEVTAIYVTHDQEEALTISDRIAVMNKGKIEQVTTPQELYTRPATRYIANFVGHANIFSGRVICMENGMATIRTAGGNELTAKLPEAMEATKEKDLHMIIRPENASLVQDGDGAQNILKGRIISRIYLGSTVRCIIDVNEEKMMEVDLNAGESAEHNEGENVSVALACEHLVLVDR